ncbi:unnamed protein product, partial [Notodromas monacha]
MSPPVEVWLMIKILSINVPRTGTVVLSLNARIFSSQALEVTLQHFPSQTYWKVGRSFFSPMDPFDLREGRNAHFGFFMSLRPGDTVRKDGWLMTLTVNKAATGFVKPGNVVDIVMEITNSRTMDDVFRRFRNLAKLRDAVKGELIGLKVKTLHNPKVPRKYGVIDVTRASSMELTFDAEINGKTRKTNVADFFKSQYNWALKFPGLPCLQVGKREKKIYIPMEVCEIVPGQTKLGRLSQQQTAALIRKTAIPAYERKGDIERTMVNLVGSMRPMLERLGMNIDSRMPQIGGRVLPAPSLSMQNGRANPSNGKWEMRSCRFFKTNTEETKWGYVKFRSSEVPDNVMRAFGENMTRQAVQTGLNLQPPVDFGTIEDPSQLRRIGAHVVNILVVVLPGREDYYGEIKRIAETEMGLMTQCLMPKHFGGGGGGGGRGGRGGRGGGFGGGGGGSGPSPQYIGNVLLKINTKLGGVNSVPVADDMTQRFLMSEPTLIVGADVTHPAPGSDQPSIAAIVGSVDLVGMKYTADIRVQGSRVEFIGDMKEVMRKRLQEFNRSTGHKPTRIIFFRDGVGEGMFKEVRSYEIAKIQEACTSLHPSYKPKITFAVVQKRHHTRLFPADQKDAMGRSGNVPAGTVVDQFITSPWFFDFYLVSHEGIQGTSKPTHYCVLWDDNQFSQNGLQAVAYYLCHCYARCTRSVSIPAPTYYSHHVALRAREYLNSIRNSDSATSSSDVSGGSKEADFDRLTQQIRCAATGLIAAPVDSTKWGAPHTNFDVEHLLEDFSLVVDQQENQLNMGLMVNSDSATSSSDVSGGSTEADIDRLTQQIRLTDNMVGHVEAKLVGLLLNRRCWYRKLQEAQHAAELNVNSCSSGCCAWPGEHSMSVGVEGAGGPGAGMRQRSSWAALCVLVLALWPEAGKLASGQAQRIALYSGADGKGQAVLLTDSCEDLGDRSKPGCTGIPAGTSFDNKAQSARIDGFWVLYNDKRFGPSDPIHYIVGMDKTVNLGRSSSKASSVRRVGSLTNWKKDEHLSLFQYKNFAGNEVVMNPYQPTFFGHEGIPAQSAVAINSEWTVVTEHQNFCLRAKGGAYVVMDFRKEFDLSLEMILHIRHGCMLATGAKNSSHGGFSVVSPTLSPSGGAQQQQPQQQPPQQQQQSMSSQQGASQQHQQMQAPLHSRMLQRRRSANHDQYGSPPLQQQQQNMYQQLELDPLNKILPPGVGSGPQLALTLTREVSTLLPAAMQEPPPQPYVDQANAAAQVLTNTSFLPADPHQPMPQQFSLKPSWSPFAAAGSGTALGNRQMSSQSAQQQPASPSALVQQEPSALAPPKQYMDQPQQQRGNLPVDAFAAEPRQMEPQQQQQQKPQGNSMRLPDRHRLTESVSTDEYQPMQKQQQQQAVPHYQQVSSGSLCGGSALSMDRRTSYAARPRVNSGRPFGRFHHKPRLERPLPAPLPAAAPQQPMPNSAQQTSDEQASGPNLQYGTQAREGYEGPENPAEMEQSKESSQGIVRSKLRRERVELVRVGDAALEDWSEEATEVAADLAASQPDGSVRRRPSRNPSAEFFLSFLRNHSGTSSRCSDSWNRSSCEDRRLSDPATPQGSIISRPGVPPPPPSSGGCETKQKEAREIYLGRHSINPSSSAEPRDILEI